MAELFLALAIMGASGIGLVTINIVQRIERIENKIDETKELVIQSLIKINEMK